MKSINLGKPFEKKNPKNSYFLQKKKFLLQLTFHSEKKNKTINFFSLRPVIYCRIVLSKKNTFHVNEYNIGVYNSFIFLL